MAKKFNFFPQNKIGTTLSIDLEKLQNRNLMYANVSEHIQHNVECPLSISLVEDGSFSACCVHVVYMCCVYVLNINLHNKNYKTCFGYQT